MTFGMYKTVLKNSERNAKASKSHFLTHIVLRKHKKGYYEDFAYTALPYMSVMNLWISAINLIMLYVLQSAHI